MRHFLLSLFVAILFAASLSPANAQVPRMFSYQGVMLNPTTGIFISDGPHNILINLYDALDATTPIYTETQHGIVFVKGIFNVMIGSVTTIPNTVAFDKGYFLGVAVDGGIEMSPRTAISPAPYSLHAVIADGLAANATGAVTSLNGQSGIVTLQGGGGTSINTNGSVLTISSSGGGGTGIQGVQNIDGSLAITSPNGPTATISVAAGGITSSKIAANAVGYVQIAGNAVGTASIADGAVTPVKINTTGSTAGQVLTSNGTSVSWQNALGGGLALPFSGSIASANAAFDVINTGLGSAGIFSITNALSTQTSLWGNTSGAAGSTAVYGSNTGLGKAGYFEISNALNAAAALSSTTNGLGMAGATNITNAANSSNSLQATTIGTGRAGYFQINNASNSTNALEATTNGSGNAVAGFSSDPNGAAGIYGKTTNASGIAVYAETSDGGAGTSSNVAIMGSSAGGTAIRGATNTGTGTYGYAGGTGVGIHGSVGAGSTTGRAGVFDQNGSSTSGNVLEATCIGSGKAGYYQINNSGNTSTALDATTNGTSNSSHGVVGTHSAISGFGAGVKGLTSSTSGGQSTSAATGVWGEVSSVTPGAWSAGVRGINDGTAALGVGVLGYHAGNGYGVYGAVGGGQNGIGVIGSAPAGAWAIYSSGKLEVSIDMAIKPTTNTWTIASDARLKNVLRPFTDGLDVLLQINPIWYRYNGLAGLPTETENIGILAQDMQQIAPYTVGTSQVKLHPDDKDMSEILTYNSHAITYVTINAIKELNQKIADLQLQIEAMQQTMKANGIDPNANGPISHK